MALAAAFIYDDSRLSLCSSPIPYKSRHSGDVVAMKLLLLGAADIDRAVDMPAAIDAVAGAFAQLSKGQAVVPQRLGVEAPDGLLLTMPGFLSGDRALAVKIVSVFGRNPSLGLPSIFGLVVVLDAATGAPRALLDGARLTAVRTGAASGLATKLMAVPSASVLTVFGAGAQARTQVAGVCAVRDVDEVRLVSRTRESAERLGREIAGRPVRVVDDASDALRGAHIVVTATTTTTPIVRGEDLDAGTHINAIGAYTTSMRELDGAAVRRSRVIVDTRAGALAEAGDIVMAIAEGAIGEEHLLGELGDVVNGTLTPRRSAADITLFKSVGNAAQDVALAAAVVAAAEAKGLGTEVTL
jgi:ornithine cyclodeaminase